MKTKLRTLLRLSGGELEGGDSASLQSEHGCLLARLKPCPSTVRTRAGRDSKCDVRSTRYDLNPRLVAIADCRFKGARPQSSASVAALRLGFHLGDYPGSRPGLHSCAASRLLTWRERRRPSDRNVLDPLESIRPYGTWLEGIESFQVRRMIAEDRHEVRSEEGFR